LLIDLRTPGQRSLGHIADDLHVPLDQLPARMAGLPVDRRLVFYCACPAEELALDGARIAMHGGRSDVAVLVGGLDGWKAAGGPVVAGTPWEAVFRTDAPPVSWGKTPVDSIRCSYARDDSLAGGGKSSGRVSCAPDSAARGFAGFTQRIAVGDLRGRRLTLSALVRSERVERMAFLWIAAEDSTGRMIPLSRPDSGPVSGSTEWRRVQVSGEVPPAAARLMVGLSLAASGRVWIDDVQLVAEEQAGRPRFPVPVRNYGFER
jgi:rhodanese-related sulfurtransferase